MSKIEHQDFVDVKLYWEKYGAITGVEVLELFDNQGVRSILIKEKKT